MESKSFWIGRSGSFYVVVDDWKLDNKMERIQIDKKLGIAAYPMVSAYLCKTEFEKITGIKMDDDEQRKFKLFKLVEEEE